jgi:hypothetical protein
MELYERIAATGKVLVTQDSRATFIPNMAFEPVTVQYSGEAKAAETLKSPGQDTAVFITRSGRVFVLTEGTSGIILMQGTADDLTEAQTKSLDLVREVLSTIAGEPDVKRTRKRPGKKTLTAENQTTTEPTVETVPTEPVQDEQILNEPDAPTTDEA